MLMKLYKEKIMEVKKFKKVRSIVDSMNSISKRVWVSADDPETQWLGVVDETLENLFEISMEDFKKSRQALTEKELICFLSGGYRWDLVKGVEISEHQKFLLSDPYLKVMANYLLPIYMSRLEKSSLRVNSDVELLSPAAVPVYDLDPEEGAYFFDEKGEKIIKSKNKRRLYVPFFENRFFIYRKCRDIWDWKVDDFIKKDDLFLKEDEYYKKIVEKVGAKVKIIMPVRTPLAVLPAMDLRNKRVGFYAFECIGIWFYKND